MSERDPFNVRMEALEKAVEEARELVRIARMGMNPAVHRDWFDRAAVFLATPAQDSCDVRRADRRNLAVPDHERLESFNSLYRDNGDR